MNKAAKSILFFGFYMIVVGILVLLIPNQLLKTFNLPPTNEVWIRFGGLFSIIVGGYYLQSARYNFIPFYQATIYGRICFALGILVFVILKYSQPILLVIAIIDIICALLTAFYLKDLKDNKKS